MSQNTTANRLRLAIAKEDEKVNRSDDIAHTHPETAAALRIFIESWHSHLVAVKMVRASTCGCLMCGTGQMMLEEFK